MPSASELFSEHLRLLATDDLTQWRDLYAPDAVYEFPYATSIQAQQRFEGIKEISSHVQVIFSQLRDVHYHDVNFHALKDPDNTIAEFEVEAVVRPTGN